MFPPKELSPAARSAVDQEARRIAELGDAWRPTSENLTEVVMAVLAAEKAVQLEKQAEGIRKAQENNLPVGRPSLEIPPAFEGLYRQCQAGELRVADVLQELGISRNTYYKWVKTLRDEEKGAPRKTDEARLLACLRDAAPGPKSMTVMSKAEIAERIGYSLAKTKSLLRSMSDKGLIEIHQRMRADGGQLANAYRITRPGRRLLKRFAEEERGEGK